MRVVAGKNRDRNLLLMLSGAMVIVLIGVSILAHTKEDNDVRPSIDNSGALGVKAAFVTLRESGVAVSRWDESFSNLNKLAPEQTTLLLLEPSLSMAESKEAAAQVRSFLERGGRVVLTGAPWASLLPGGEVQQPGTFAPKLCYSTPEGPGPLAAAGKIETRFDGGWSAKGPLFRTEQRCMDQAIVVRFPVGKGEAIWWTSSTPISNAGLLTENNLKFVLASLGPGRTVVFDEYVHATHNLNEHLFDGLPRWWLLAQFAMLFGLVVFSFSRRKGPLRLPVGLPRSSPLEFANSMGDLYEKAGATAAATDAAKRRLQQMLQREAGLSRAAFEDGPDAVASSLSTRLGGDWSAVADNLRRADVAHESALNAKSTLVLVKALREDEVRVRRALHPHGSAEQSSGGSKAESVEEN